LNLREINEKGVERKLHQEFIQFTLVNKILDTPSKQEWDMLSVCTPVIKCWATSVENLWEESRWSDSISLDLKEIG
jgi:hypothetical protein